MKKLLAPILVLVASSLAAEPHLNNLALSKSINRAFSPLLMQLVGQYGEDSAHTSGHVGSMVLGVRRDTPTSLAGADNDYMPLTFNNVGALWVAGNGTFTVGDGAGALNVIVDSGTITTVTTLTGTTTLTPGTAAANLGKAEDAVAGSGDTGVGVLAVRNDAGTALAADGDYIPLTANSAGALYVTGGGGGTEYTEDVAAPADPTGATFMMTRDDQIATVTEVEGDWSRPRSTSKGALWVALADSAGDPITSFGGGTEYSQGTATTDTDALKMAGAVRRDTAAVATGVIDGDRLVLSTDSVGRLRTTSADVTQPVSGTVTANAGSGTFVVGDGAGALNVIVDSGAVTTELETADLDTGAGTDTNAVVGMRLAKSGGSALVGAGADGDPVPISDDGGSLTVDGTVTVTDGAGALNVIVDSSALPSGASTSAEQATQTASLSVLDDWDNAASDGATVSGDVAHDAADAGEPVKIGHKAVAHVAPTEVAASDRVDGIANRDGVQFVVGGNPGVITREASWADADGAQTGASIVTVATGTLICVTQLLVTCSLENTVKVSVRVMFDTDATFAARSTTGVDGGLFDHRGIGPGGGATRGDGSGLLGCGTDDQDLRYSGDDPVSGSCSITATYYTSAS